MNEVAAWVVSSWCLCSRECGRNGLFRDVQEPPTPQLGGGGHSHMIMSETLVVSSRGGIADFGLTKGVEDEIKSHIDIPLVRVVRKEIYMYAVEPQSYHR